MDFSTLMLSLLFGAVGMGYLLYGKNVGQLMPIGAGLGLMLSPYFISNLIILLIVCCLLVAVPFVVRQ